MPERPSTAFKTSRGTSRPHGADSRDNPALLAILLRIASSGHHSIAFDVPTGTATAVPRSILRKDLNMVTSLMRIGGTLGAVAQRAALPTRGAASRKWLGTSDRTNWRLIGSAWPTRETYQSPGLRQQSGHVEPWFAMRVAPQGWAPPLNHQGWPGWAAAAICPGRLRRRHGTLRHGHDASTPRVRRLSVGQSRAAEPAG